MVKLSTILPANGSAFNDRTQSVLGSVPAHRLESMLPGISIVQAFLGIDISNVASLCFVLIAFTGALKYLGDAFWRRLNTWIMCSVSVDSNDPLFTEIEFWVSRQHFMKRTKRLRAKNSYRDDGNKLYVDTDKGVIEVRVENLPYLRSRSSISRIS